MGFLEGKREVELLTMRKHPVIVQKMKVCTRARLKLRSRCSSVSKKRSPDPAGVSDIRGSITTGLLKNQSS